uniref:Sulfotransferase n=1 Tax=Sander lucioperca TaxID=283035 RepID=A0A8C9ZR76_SANLU
FWCCSRGSYRLYYVPILLLLHSTTVLFFSAGTVWMQEILPLVLNGGNGCGSVGISTGAGHTFSLPPHAPFLPHLQSQGGGGFSLVSLPQVIYVMRNPKDVMVSSYFFHQMAEFLEDPGTFDEFMDKFLEGRVTFGKWTDHVKGWRDTELGDRIMYITYEEMAKDLPAAVRRFSDFLGRNLSEEVIQKIAEHCSFKTMKTNKMSNFSLVPKEFMNPDKSPFFRKGVAGDWENHFSSEQLARFTSAIRKEMESASFSLPWSME